MKPDQLDLLKKSPVPTIVLTGEVNTEMYSYVGEAIMLLRSAGNPAIEVVIDSHGGDTAAGLDIYDLIRLYPGQTTGTVYNKAFSMGAIILQACKQRRCARHASLLIHHVSKKNVSLESLTHRKKLMVLIKDLREIQKRLTEILMFRTGKTAGVITKTCRKDKMMATEEALAFGLIDEII